MFSSRLKSDAGVALTALVIGFGSLLAGTAAAVAGVVAVINNYGPGDSHAEQTGPKDVLPPDAILSYGG